ncbi:hypothetical protein AAIB33_02155 [Microbacterium sp. AZCO]|uniref:hypothetical protein n=1 Tax=Microbacterium sp. AZCO TaxID=3142976 RepID=UPI0031F35595
MSGGGGALRPLGLTSLKPGEYACERCGVAVPTPIDAAREYQVIAKIGGGFPGGNAPRPSGAMYVVRMGLCEVCTARDESAREVLKAHPRIQRLSGAESTGLHRIAQVLDALAVLGRTADLTPALSDQAVLAAINLLMAEGSAVRWMARFAPVIEAGAQEGSCAVEPWLHVDTTARLGLREAYGRWMLARAGLRPRIPCPDPSGGCMFCGVSWIDGGEWRAASVRPSSVGGFGPEPLRGHLCTLCAEAVDSAGALGRTALEFSLVAALGVPGVKFTGGGDDLGGLIQLHGLRAWAAVNAQPGHRRVKPCAEPWGFIADSTRDALREQLMGREGLTADV